MAQHERSGCLSTVKIYDFLVRAFFDMFQKPYIHTNLIFLTISRVTQSEIQEQRQRLKIHGWAKAENTSRDHILNHHMVRLPLAAAPCGEGRLKAARQYVVSACIFNFYPAKLVQLLAQSMYFGLLPSFELIHIMP